MWRERSGLMLPYATASAPPAPAAAMPNGLVLAPAFGRRYPTGLGVFLLHRNVLSWIGAGKVPLLSHSPPSHLLPHLAFLGKTLGKCLDRFSKPGSAQARSGSASLS